MLDRTSAPSTIHIVGDPAPSFVLPSPYPTPEPSPSPAPSPSPYVLPAAPESPAKPKASPTPKPSPAVAPAPDNGPTVTIADGGIWVLDAADRSVRRVSDSTAFDVAGDRTLLARGMDVYEVPVSGGETVRRYTVASMSSGTFSNGYSVDLSRETITSIEAAPDGSAVIGATAPVVGPDVSSSSRTGSFALVDPTGAIKSRDITSDVEWSDDGSLLAVTDYRGIRALRPDGSTVWGPVAPPWKPFTRVTWAHDNQSLSGEGNGHRFHRYDIQAGRWDEIPTLWRHVDYGPDGRAIGQRLPPADWNGMTHPGVVVWDPASGGVTPFTPTGYDAVWSPGGSKVWMLDAPLTGKENGSRFSLRVYDAAAARIVIATLRDGLAFSRDDGGGPLTSLLPPQWATGDRYHGSPHRALLRAATVDCEHGGDRDAAGKGGR
jgi:hypothetical protein